jgi:hypothetical protein
MSGPDKVHIEVEVFNCWVLTQLSSAAMCKVFVDFEIVDSG